MEEKELLGVLRGEEWTDVEFKEASRDVPKSAYETVSSFSNTKGGTLIFGIRREGTEYIVSGVVNFDKVQNDFLSALKGGMKFNHQIDVREDTVEIGDKRVLIFHIPESDRVKKPIFLNGDIRKSFIRRGGCDHRCTPEEINRFLRDSSYDRWDGITVDLPTEESFDHESISWYRKRFEENNPGYSNGEDIDFLYEWGFLIRKDDKLLPTRASIILFGSRSSLHQILTKPIIDLQWIPAGIKDEQPEMRWYDRIVLEENLINTWREVVRKFIHYSPKPFRIDPHTMMRDDTPPYYRVFRELTVNLLIHQDYGDQGRKGVIKFFKDGILFWNPGDVFGRYDDL
ncbi:MAG: AlbA family DNA-binding domain-containing protein, partial [Candidatus Thorarchaeota archaeon]